MEVLGHAQPRHYRKGQIVMGSGAPIRSALFVNSGTISASVPINDGEAVEVFAIGNEGVTGGWSRQDFSDFRLAARSDVQGMSVDLAALHLIADRRRKVAEMLTDYGARLARELAHNSACNLHHRIGPRLSKWLLRNDDREEGGLVAMTTRAVADALGVQERLARTHLRALHDEGALETSRLWLRVLKRDVFLARACSCYDPLRSVCDRPRTPPIAQQTGLAFSGRQTEAAA